MSMQLEVGTFDANTGGTQTTVTTGFQGSAAIFWTWGKTSTGESAVACFSMGFTDGTNYRGVGWSGDDAVATTNVGRIGDTTHAGIVLTNGNPTLGTGGRVTTVAFNATPNMVVTFDGTPASAWKWNYILFAGTDFTNIKVGQFTAATSTGNQSTTDPGFQPDAALFLCPRVTAGSASATAYMDMGFAVSAAKQWALRTKVSDAQAVGTGVDGIADMRDDQVLVGSTTTTAVDYVADFTQFTATGWDWNWSDAASSAWLIFYIAWKGGHWDAGVSTKPAGATTQTETGLAYVPKLLAMLMSSPTALNSVTSNAINTFGATDGTNQVWGGGYHNDDINSVAKSGGAATAMQHEMNASANATLSSFGASGNWTIAWDATGTAFKTPWFTVGDTLAGEAPPAASFGDYAGQFRIIRPTSW